MAAKSDYLENLLVDYLFRGGAAAAPAHIWIALLTTGAVDSDTGSTISGGGGTGVEVSGGSYARTQLDPSSTNWRNTQNSGSGVSTGTNGTTSNNVAVTFPTATGSWGTVVGVAICDASSGGNLLYYGLLGASKTVGNGDIFSFAAGALSVQVDN